MQQQNTEASKRNHFVNTVIRLSGAEDAVRDDQGLENENKGIRGEVKK